MDRIDTLIRELEGVKEGSRFWSKVDKGGPGGCWLWTASRTPKGYGQFSVGGRKAGNYRMLKAHRVAYLLLRGIIPATLELDHLCRVRHCVNPDHLEPVTNTENIRRGISPSAVGARKTHCPQGHPYSGNNLYTNPSGFRICRTCKRAALREYKERRRARETA